jgi:sortase A
VRRTVNALGRVLVTVGTLMLLFVAWQLWGTGLYESAQQSALRSDFEHARARNVEAAKPVSGTTTTTAPLPPPAEGEPVAIIRIPKIGVDATVVQGVAVPDLRKGPGHYPDSPMPGQLGNAAIAGHRTTYGAPFNRLDELGPGDEISIQALSGTTYRYTVNQQLIVTPKQVEVLDATPNATLTLTTCNPKYSARERLVIKATLDPAANPLPTKPAKAPITTARTRVDDLSGSKQSRLPLIWAGLVVAAIGGAWWFAFHRKKTWWVWVLGAIPFLAAYALFCFYLERVLPPGF